MVRGVLTRVVAVFCMILLLEQTPSITTISVHAAETTATTSFSHSSPPYIQPWRRTIISAQISDPAGVKLARCYFRASADDEYVYVIMKAETNGTFTATLPALGNIAKLLQYRLLTVNNAGHIVRTADFVVPVDRNWGHRPSWQSDDYGTAIQVFTEAEQAAVAARGLLRVDDTYTIASTDPTERYLSNPSVHILTTDNETTKPDSTTKPSASATSLDLLASPQKPEQLTITTKSTNPMLFAATPSHSADQKEAIQQSGASTIMGMKPSTFWWIIAGVAAVAIGGTVAALSSGGGGGGGAKTGSVVVHW
jgi:hypothetical protein